LGPRKQRSVLAALLVDVGQVVGDETLIDRVWNGSPPAEVRNVLYTPVSRIRRLLASVTAASGEPTSLNRRAHGYLLDVARDRVDLHRFRQLVIEARVADDLEWAAKLYRDALGLWRGGLWGDLAG